MRKTLSEEHKKKISMTMTGRKLSKEHIKALTGRKLSKEHREALSKALKGHKVSKETREKISKSTVISKEQREAISRANTGNKYRLGKKLTEEHKRAVSKAQMGNKNNLGKQNALGYKHTEEAKRKISESHMGEKNGNWQGGKSTYPYEYNRELRQTIFDRDGDICVLCGNVFHKQNGVHHIDYDKENCVTMNLITACKSCNARVNTDREYWQGYFTDLMEIMVV